MAQALDQQTSDTGAVRLSSIAQSTEAVHHQSPMNLSNMSPSSRSARSLRSPEETRLSVIEEDGDIQGSAATTSPLVPPRSTHRPFARRWRDAPPRASSDLKPPEYSTLDDSKQRPDRLAELRNKPVVTRRGGWKRLLLIIVGVVAILAIALGVGLGIGLKNRRQDDGVSDSGLPVPTNGSGLGFPVGRYAVNAFLDTVNTSCTSNAATFRCYPYSIFSTDSSRSAVTFNWIISGYARDYIISSSDNPFAIAFSNVSLVLRDAGTVSERYSFSFKMNKEVVPSLPLTSDNSAVECFFNGTTLSAALYTKRNSSTQADTSTGDGWQAWPFAAEISQTISGGENVPACYEMTNGALGSPVTSGLTEQPSNAQCGCFWKNFDL